MRKLSYGSAPTWVFVTVTLGIAIWQPVQIYSPDLLFGGIPGACLVHFLAIEGIAGFAMIFLAAVALIATMLVTQVTDKRPRAYRRDRGDNWFSGR